MVVCVNLHPYIDENITDGYTSMVAGGRGISVAKDLMVLGVDVFVLGLMADEDEDFFHAEMVKSGIKHTFVVESGTVKRNIRRHIAGKYTEKTVQSFFISQKVATQLLAEADTAFAQASAVVLSGVLSRGLPADFYAQLIDHVPRHIPVFLDTSSEALKYAMIKRPFFVKPNKYELEEYVGKKIVTLTDMKAAIIEFIEAGASCALISMGAEGGIICDGQTMYFAGCKSDVLSPLSGSGDSMLAACVASVLAGANMASVLVAGIAAGAARAMTGGDILDFVLYSKLIEEIEFRQI